MGGVVVAHKQRLERRAVAGPVHERQRHAEQPGHPGFAVQVAVLDVQSRGARADLDAAVVPREVAVLVADLVGEPGAAGEVRHREADPEGLHATQHVRAQLELADGRRPGVDLDGGGLRRLGAAVHVHRPEGDDVLAVARVVAGRLDLHCVGRLGRSPVDLDVGGRDRGDLAGGREGDGDGLVVPGVVGAVSDGHRRRAVDAGRRRRRSGSAAVRGRRGRDGGERERTSSAHAATMRTRMVSSSHPLSHPAPPVAGASDRPVERIFLRPSRVTPVRAAATPGRGGAVARS